MTCREIRVISTRRSKAAAALETIDFDYTYEVHMTSPTGCAALRSRLFTHTKEIHYIEASLMPLAKLLRLVWWWECDYGLCQGLSHFHGPLAHGGS